MLKSYKRAFYIEQLRLLRIVEVDGVPVQKLSDRDLKYALTKARIRAGA